MVRFLSSKTIPLLFIFLFDASWADSSKKILFEFSDSSLDKVLTRIAAQSEVKIAFKNADTVGLKVVGVKGYLSVEEA